MNGFARGAGGRTEDGGGFRRNFLTCVWRSSGIKSPWPSAPLLQEFPNIEGIYQQCYICNVLKSDSPHSKLQKCRPSLLCKLSRRILCFCRPFSTFRKNIRTCRTNPPPPPHLVTWVESERRGEGRTSSYSNCSPPSDLTFLCSRGVRIGASFFLISCMREAVEGSTHPPSHTYSASHRRRLTHELRV